MSSSSTTILKSNYEITSKIEALYTGGKIQFSGDEEYVFCLCTEKVQVVQVDSGKIVHSLEEEGDVISCFASSPDDQYLVTAGKNLLLRQWDWKEGKQTKTWKAIHVAPISSMVFDSTSTLLATGSSDSTIKVWDIVKQYYTHNLKGSKGVVSLVQFHPNSEVLQLFSASDDCKIRIWDLNKSRCIVVLESHFSVVTSLAFNSSHKTMISSSRDNVLNMWDLENIHQPNRKPPRTIPCYEGVESVVMVTGDQSLPGFSDKDGECFITAGSKGQLRFWNLKTGKCVHTLSVKESLNIDDDNSQHIVHATLCEKKNMLSVVTFDHNIMMYDLQTLKKTKQLVGYNDDILDMCFAGPDNKHLAVATNSNDIRIYEMDTLDCRILSGHSNIVLSLDVNTDGCKIVTGSKDNEVRIWNMDTANHYSCVAVGKGHTHAVSTVAWSRTGDEFVVSGSQDSTIKVWTVPQSNADLSVANMIVKVTEKVHDKDVNSVAVSPNDKLLATGSQDKTAKVWRTKDGTLLGTLRGHKRGVWCVQFSPVDQCIVSASGDSTIKIWALSDMTCVKTFEGHSSSVLKVMFVSRGMQLVSSGSDGLVKLWTIKTNECVKTFDQHNDKVWCIAANRTEELLLSGGADSVINIWKDVTLEEQQQAHEESEKTILMEQELSNLLYDKKYIDAVGLAITLDQPWRVLKIFKDMLLSQEGREQLEHTIKALREDQIDAVVRYIVDWNTNAKNTHTSQTVLSIILKSKSPYDLMERPNIKETIEAILPYTERHMRRMNRLLQQSEFLEYTWQRMKLSSATDSHLQRYNLHSGNHCGVQKHRTRKLTPKSHKPRRPKEPVKSLLLGSFHHHHHQHQQQK
ncbi:transducin beta-like protein 3 isoform X2 [Actinia tenebrosa]|uniref:Transducin beta-like protein 3 isoform X2 n=1 Tax=Actinia tenebrosa TaxID=6105 RepID=A0A6P8I8H6_ACTTE|nr:transducin beta-like protein 3 isoform X2 [Actinia tenebrosa]